MKTKQTSNTQTVSDPGKTATTARFEVQPPPGTGDKLLRTLWGFVWLVLYRPSPTIAHGWRRFILRSFGARIGSGAHPYPSAWIWAPWNLEMGSRSCLGPGANCYSAAKVYLESDSIVSQGAHLCSASHDFRDPGFPLVTGPIFIRHGAWVAAEAFIGPGLEVGAGAVVGARSVVTKDVAPECVVAGNPAQEIGTR